LFFVDVNDFKRENPFAERLGTRIGNQYKNKKARKIYDINPYISIHFKLACLLFNCFQSENKNIKKLLELSFFVLCKKTIKPNSFATTSISFVQST